MGKHNAGHCPVCGMRVDSEQYSAEYQKQRFYFCSEQCRENFLQQPGLYSGGKARQHGEIIKRRRLRLLNPLTPEPAQQAIERLRAMVGVKEVHIEGRRITIRYDLLQVRLAQLENAFNTLEASLKTAWWQRLRSAWIHNTEANELANIAAGSGACCSRPPPRVSGR